MEKENALISPEGSTPDAIQWQIPQEMAQRFTFRVDIEVVEEMKCKESANCWDVVNGMELSRILSERMDRQPIKRR